MPTKKGAKRMIALTDSCFRGSAQKKMATLIIGNHQLKGHRKSFARPIAVTKKRKFDDALQREDEVEDDESAVEYQVVGILRSKYVFKSRPKPITSKRLKA